MLAGWIGLLVACALSVMQFFVIGRGFHTTDILMRLVGLAIGVDGVGDVIIR